ncbi:uncharacterized protein LOC122260490 [Penaeus japonicus]|uniref:uncharacterized protein LOC122260490 n=1 Tax=Penaeus japonicus TaxID=27405 RepID=UPI001C70D13F|nr:uncharacterized protein LOC122260490 [Penaeus japonicus]
MNKFALSLLFCVCAVTCVSAREDDDARLIGVYTMRTATVLSTLTSTVPYTCYRNINTQVCQGRRLRRFVNMADLEAGEQGEISLDGSQSEPEMPEEEQMELERRVERSAGEGEGDDDAAARSRALPLAFTFWSISSSTYTVTTTSINASTTFSLSYYCTAVGAPLAPSC